MSFAEDEFRRLAKVAADLKVAHEAEQHLRVIRQQEDFARTLGMRSEIGALSEHFKVGTAAHVALGLPGGALAAGFGITGLSAADQIGQTVAQLKAGDAISKHMARPGSALAAALGITGKSAIPQIGAYVEHLKAEAAARIALGQPVGALEAARQAAISSMGLFANPFKAPTALAPSASAFAATFGITGLSAAEQLSKLAAEFKAGETARGMLGEAIQSFDVTNASRLIASMSELVRAHSEYELHHDEGTENIDPDEPSAILHAASSRSTAQDGDALVQLIENSVRALHSSTNTQQNDIFWTRVYPFILAILTLLLAPVADHFIKQALATASPSQNSAPKQVNTAVRNFGFSPLMLSGHRIVDAKSSLPVRATARMNAKELGRLPRACVVEVLQVEGRWTLVRWSDEKHSIVLQGWVSTRYLKKFQ
ncbi:hypothetical protein SAMN05216320_109181 [Duganella sp. OV458]|nr:hypothetical protein SAMN05216320_109181 [Duganella sp. OV458]SDK18959.1 hypothetical protein SAMN05428973_109101 [Duganella sp. OV510]